MPTYTPPTGIFFQSLLPLVVRNFILTSILNLDMTSLAVIRFFCYKCTSSMHFLSMHCMNAIQLYFFSSSTLLGKTNQALLLILQNTVYISSVVTAGLLWICITFEQTHLKYRWVELHSFLAEGIHRLSDLFQKTLFWIHLRIVIAISSPPQQIDICGIFLID